MHDRVEYVSRNIFESVPEWAGIYLLKQILQTWSDEESIKILKNYYRAMNDTNGKVF